MGAELQACAHLQCNNFCSMTRKRHPLQLLAPWRLLSVGKVFWNMKV